MKKTDPQEINVFVPNPLMAALRIPGESFRLPSQGLFYSDDDGIFDESVKNGEVEVYPMTTIDEIIISTPDKLLSGKAIVEVFQHCIPQILKPDKLLAKDVDFLMVCLRMVSFGPTMEVVYTHDCKDAKQHTYVVDLQSIIRQAKTIDPTTIATEYSTTLSNGQVVTLQPMTFGDVIDLYQTTSLPKSSDDNPEETVKMLAKTLTGVIKDVNGVTDKSQIMEWVAGISLGHKKQIQETAHMLSNWGVDMISMQECKDCHEETELRVSANPVSFFS
jgi:hypothetical protein